MAAPEMPDGVLVQSTNVSDEGERAGWRVWADGRHEGRRVGEEWVAAPPIDPARMSELRAILADPAVDALAGRHEAAARSEHGSTLWFQVARPGGPVTVEVMDGAQVPELEALHGRLLPVLSGLGG
jgi:hypothetical protein